MSIAALVNFFLLAAASASEQAAENGGEEKPELANFVLMISNWFKSHGHENISNFLLTFENTIFFTIIIIIPLAVWAIVTYRKVKFGPDRESRRLIPRGFSQNFWEWIVQMLADFTEQGLGLGDRGRTYIPFVGSLFLFILLNNLLGVIPFMKSATSSLNTTLGLAGIVFLTVQIHGIRALGPLGWLKHLAGIETGAPLEYALMLLMFPLHVLGELIKPISLSLRLFGNIFGEDMLIAIFVGLGAFAFIPFQTPFYFLALLTSFIQTMVFTLLACSYIANFSHTHEHGAEAME